jgi:hypothetical protein
MTQEEFKEKSALLAKQISDFLYESNAENEVAIQALFLLLMLGYQDLKDNDNKRVILKQITSWAYEMSLEFIKE